MLELAVDARSERHLSRAPSEAHSLVAVEVDKKNEISLLLFDQGSD